MKKILLLFLLLLSIQVSASPQSWTKDFLERYRQGKEETLARLADHRKDIDGKLYAELFKVLSDDLKYEDYRLNFDVFTGSPSNITSLKILKAEQNGKSTSVTVQTGFDGVRGPSSTEVKLLLTKSGAEDYKVEDVIYTDWSTPTSLSALLKRLQTPDYSTQPLDLVPDELDSNRRPIMDQSFLFSEGGLYPLRFVTSISQGRTPHLELFVHSGSGGTETVGLSETVPSGWSFDEVRALAFGDFNNDGFGPDVLCVASFRNGAQATGVTRIFYRTRYQGIKHSKGDRYSTDPKLNEMFDKKNVETVSEALKLLD